MRRFFSKANLVNYGIPLLLFGLITFLIYPHLFTGFSNQIEKNDGRLLAWTVSWDLNKLLTDPLNLYNANIFYPNQSTLTYSEHFLGGSILALPVYILSGGNPTASFNFLMILGFILNAFSAYVLIKHLTKSKLAAFIGAVIFGYCSYRIINYAHLQNSLVFYIPFLTYFVIRYFENKRRLFLIGAGLSLLGMSLTSWYHMIFIWLLFALLLFYYLIKKQFTKRDFINFGILIGVNLLIILPFALPYFEFNKQNQSAYTINDLKTYSADIGGYLLPPPNTVVGGEVLPFFRIDKERWSENMNFIGFIALILSIIGILSFRNSKNEFQISVDKSKIKYVLMALVFFIFSLGPFLHIADQVTRIPLVYWLVYNLLPPIRFIRVTARFATVFYMFIGILAGFGMVKILNRFKSKKFAVVFSGLLVCVILFEYYPYNRFYDLYDTSKTPEVYNYIKDNNDVKALIEMPINVGPFDTTQYVYYSGIHFKPIVNGYSGFEPKDHQFNKYLFENFTNTLGFLKLKQLGVTHLLINPGFEYNLDSNLYKLEKEAEGYRLYKLEDTEIDYKAGYFTDFSGKEFKSNYSDITYTFNNTNVVKPTPGTPLYNVSPKQVNTSSSFTISTAEEFDKVYLSFRVFSANDYLKIDCVTNSENSFEYSFSDADFLEEQFGFNCSSNKINLELFSTENPDRSMITSIGFIDVEGN